MAGSSHRKYPLPMCVGGPELVCSSDCIVYMSTGIVVTAWSHDVGGVSHGNVLLGRSLCSLAECHSEWLNCDFTLMSLS